mmetsp:Transcript_11710/g.24990  ORF Transcript_11710/g.24990 Transcript_11710/m.24990 type:complete len:300 (-) Transcript_11710:204-1103(-)
MAAASSSSLPAGNSLCLNDGNIPDNNSNDCNNRRCCCDKNDNIRNAANVTSNMTADGSDTFRTAARPTPLVTENSIASNTATAATYSPRRHPTATSTSSPLRKKKNAVVESRSSKTSSSKKQPLGKMWIRHVPISAKPHSNYYDCHNKNSNRYSNTFGNNTFLGRSRNDRRDSTDSFASSSLFLVSPASDYSPSPSRPSPKKDWRAQSIFVDSNLPMPLPLPLLHPYSHPQPQAQPKYFYRRPHTLRSSFAVHAFGESGKPLSSSLTASSSTSPSPSPSPTFWKDCSHDYIIHDDALLL